MTTSESTANQAQTAELIQALRQRATTYGLLSRLFRKEVDQELLDELHDSPYRVSTGNDATDQGNRLMATYLSGSGKTRLLNWPPITIACFLATAITGMRLPTPSKAYTRAKSACSCRTFATKYSPFIARPV